MATLSAIFVYPVKSMRGSACQRAQLTTTGIAWDRQWMVIDGAGTFLSQRTHPKLARIVPEVRSDTLALSASGMPELSVPLSAAGEAIPVRVWKDSCLGIVQGEGANEWVSEVLGAAVRLVRVAPAMVREANRQFAGATPAPLNFPDGYPVLVCNESSLEDLNSRLPAAIPMERFRPNLVLQGLPAWSEDEIDTISVGAVTLRLVKPCTRCAIPSLDHLTGDPSTDPLPVLRTFRWSKALHGITFGENAVIASGVGEELRRGMTCRVSFEAATATAT